MIYAFAYGVILAIGLIMPLGVQNTFIFNQGATQNHFWRALPSVLTASLCDAMLILLAVLGVSVAVVHISWLKLVIFIFGFFFLAYMGWMIWRSQSAQSGVNAEPFSVKRQIVFALSVSILNPHAIIDSVGVIGTSALQFNTADRWIFTIACILVSVSWFFGLSVAGYFLKKMDTSGRILNIVNKISAVIIWSVAAFIGWQLILMAKI